MSKNQPNIILINCDDLGYGDLSCYGSRLNATPALDRLAAEGLKCTNFYMASAICTPSRAGMLTGCYPQRISMNRVFFPGDHEGLNPREETIASMLKGVGYSTALIGKWHLGDQPEFLPGNYGFDFYYGLPYSNDMGRQVGDPEDKTPLPLLLDDEVIEEQPDQSGITARYVDESIRFIRESQTVDGAPKPFFLYFAHMYVHLPLYVPERFNRESKNGRYGAAVACIDWAWDKLDYELKRLSIDDNTLVLFTSDNGSRAQGEGGSNEPFRGTKFTTWEGGFRLPLIARYPRGIEPGICDEMITSMDLLPTLASFAGAELKGEHEIDGVDMFGLLTGEVATGRDEFSFFSEGNLCALRLGEWKLHFCIRVEGGKPFGELNALFNLAEDPGESENLFDRHPEIVARIRDRADELRRIYGDVFTGTTGSCIRACGVVDDPKPLTVYDPNHPYMIAEYDLADRG